jgi:hypothetical protein
MQLLRRGLSAKIMDPTRRRRKSRGESAHVALKLLCVVSKEKIVAFCLSRESLLQEDITAFIRALLWNEMATNPPTNHLYLVLDNAPKNRGQAIKNMCLREEITLVYITPTTPEHNFTENFFWMAKK